MAELIDTPVQLSNHKVYKTLAELVENLSRATCDGSHGDGTCDPHQCLIFDLRDKLLYSSGSDVGVESPKYVWIAFGLFLREWLGENYPHIGIKTGKPDVSQSCGYFELEDSSCAPKPVQKLWLYYKHIGTSQLTSPRLPKIKSTFAREGYELRAELVRKFDAESLMQLKFGNGRGRGGHAVSEACEKLSKLAENKRAEGNYASCLLIVGNHLVAWN